jgi:hypothetical protein
MRSASPGRVREDGLRRRHERSASEKSIEEAVDEDPATPGVE